MLLPLSNARSIFVCFSLTFWQIVCKGKCNIRTWFIYAIFSTIPPSSSRFTLAFVYHFGTGYQICFSTLSLCVSVCLSVYQFCAEMQCSLWQGHPPVAMVEVSARQFVCLLVCLRLPTLLWLAFSLLSLPLFVSHSVEIMICSGWIGLWLISVRQYEFISGN